MRHLFITLFGFTACGLPVQLAGGPTWAVVGFGIVGVLLLLVGTQVGINTNAISEL